jgi:hypothetical protein
MQEFFADPHRVLEALPGADEAAALTEVGLHRVCTSLALAWLSDPEELLLLGLEFLLAQDALVTKLGEALQLAHVPGLG